MGEQASTKMRVEGARTVKHEWEYPPSTIQDLGNYGRRRCKHCKAEQTKEAHYLWMRVTGYRWYPLVGRCKGGSDDD